MLTFQIFAAPLAVSWRCTRPWKIGQLSSRPTTTCCLPRRGLLPPTTTCPLPRLPATFPRLPATFPRLPAASHDYPLPPTTTCCLPRRLLDPRLPATSHDTCCPPKNGGIIAMVASVKAFPQRGSLRLYRLVESTAFTCSRCRLLVPHVMANFAVISGIITTSAITNDEILDSVAMVGGFFMG